MTRKHWLDAWILDAIQAGALSVTRDGVVEHKGIVSSGNCMIHLRHAGAKALVDVDRIVACYHHANPFGQPDVMHQNGRPEDTSPSNLSWGYNCRSWPAAPSKSIFDEPRFSAYELLTVRRSKLPNDELSRRYHISEADVRRIKKHDFATYVQ